MQGHFFLCLDNIVLVDAGSYLDKFFLFFIKIFYFLKTLKKFYWEIFILKKSFSDGGTLRKGCS